MITQEQLDDDQFAACSILFEAVKDDPELFKIWFGNDKPIENPTESYRMIVFDISKSDEIDT